MLFRSLRFLDLEFVGGFSFVVVVCGSGCSCACCCGCWLWWWLLDPVATATGYAFVYLLGFG